MKATSTAWNVTSQKPSSVMKLKREARHKFMSLTSCWILWEPWLEEYLCNTVSMKVCEICKVREVVQSSPYSCSGQEFLIHYLNPYLTGEQGKLTFSYSGDTFQTSFHNSYPPNFVIRGKSQVFMGGSISHCGGKIILHPPSPTPPFSLLENLSQCC